MKISIAAIGLLLFLILPSTPALAQTDSLRVYTPSPKFQTIQDLTPSDYVRTILNFLLGSAGVVSTVFLLYGGIRWITSGGDKDSAEKARKIILQALTGLAIVFSSYVILYAFRVFFNLDLIQTPFYQIGYLSSETGNPASYSGTAYACTNCTPATPPAGGACPCGGPSGTGLCAANGTLASISYYGSCYQCTDGLWVATGDTGCAPITCGPCN